LVGATFPLGKLAAQAGVPPASWAWSMAAGAGLLLLAFALAARRGVPVGARHLRYYAAAATISFVAPNVLVSAAIPRLGAGFTSAMAAAMLLVAVLAFGGARGIEALAGVPALVAAQAVAGAAMLALFFRLQEVGGPVFLGQIGYVAAAVGLVSGTALLGERYAAATWTGALVVVAGVALVTRSQARETGPGGLADRTPGPPPPLERPSAPR
jgi:drug/metabolite transporter (DMT)-like permease